MIRRCIVGLSALPLTLGLVLSGPQIITGKVAGMQSAQAATTVYRCPSECKVRVVTLSDGSHLIICDCG